MPTYFADRRLYVTADRERVVEHGDPDARFLLAAEGAEIPPQAVDRYDLTKRGGRIVLPDEGEPEAKMGQPAENKMVVPGEDKQVDATGAAEELADEEDIDLAGVEGSGKNGRILKSDVQDVLE